MAGVGSPPKAKPGRRRTVKPARGEWRSAGGAGWRHGKMPTAPRGMTKAARDAWAVWMSSWIAWFWEPEDLPGLRHVVRLYDQVERGEFHRHAEMRIAMDCYGITPKGQQDRRWRPMTGDVVEQTDDATVTAIADYRAMLNG